MSKFKEFEKRYGKLPGNDVSKNNNQNQGDSNFVANAIAFIFQLFITGPNKNWRNPLSIVLMGLVFLGINLFLLFSPSRLESFVEFFGFGENMTIVMSATVYIYLIIQCIRGIWIVGGWNQNPIGDSYRNVPPSGGIVRGGSRAYYKDNTNHMPDAIGETYSWMNSKMQSMTNNQRESYLRDFHGGKK